MGLLLNNARLSVSMGANYSPPIQKVKPARPSIAEDAVFIPKPHKRVDFKLDTGKPGGADIAGGNGGGEHVSLKSLGAHGLTAEFGNDAQLANGAPRVVMEVITNPEKDFRAIETQEEGRQSHNAGTTHFTQAYDAYGRPRIGMSREPYDFAFTKWMIKTSQLKFQQNVAEAQAQFKEYFFNPDELTDPNAQKVKEAEQVLTNGAVEQGMVKPDPQALVNGDSIPEKLKKEKDPTAATGADGEKKKVDEGSVMVPNALKGDEAEKTNEADDNETKEVAQDIFKPMDQLNGSKAAQAYAPPEDPAAKTSLSVSA